MAFGIETELEYTGNLSQVTQLLPLPRRHFASADETHIRIWAAEGDAVKKTFPSNQRSMVTAIAYCPSLTALLTAEVDMTLKLYSTGTLETMESFSLDLARKGSKGRGSHRVTSLFFF